jgi:hypothetical protein
MDSALRMLMDATTHINASSAEERLSSIQGVVEAVNRINSLSPEDQVKALTEVHNNVKELRQRVEAVTAEYEEARVWLKVLEGVVRQGVGVSTPAVEPAPADDGAASATATVLAEKPDLTRAAET